MLIHTFFFIITFFINIKKLVDISKPNCILNDIHLYIYYLSPFLVEIEDFLNICTAFSLGVIIFWSCKYNCFNLGSLILYYNTLNKITVYRELSVHTKFPILTVLNIKEKIFIKIKCLSISLSAQFTIFLWYKWKPKRLLTSINYEQNSLLILTLKFTNTN